MGIEDHEVPDSGVADHEDEAADATLDDDGVAAYTVRVLDPPRPRAEDERGASSRPREAGAEAAGAALRR